MPDPHPPKTRKGAWSAEEKAYLKESFGKISFEEMAKHLNRDLGTLKRWVERNLVPNKPEPDIQAEKAETVKQDIRSQFRNTLAWKKFKDEFTHDELLYFEEEYIDLYHQFQCDVYKTEEQQIRKAITLDILMRRNLSARKKLLTDITRMEDWQGKATRDYNRDKEGLDVSDRQEREEFLLNLETQLQSLRSAEQSKTKEFADLDNRHQKLMEALKATREQRISRVESSKQSWLGVLRELAEEERAQQEGRIMELMREATSREFQRLARPHVYDDGNADQPILSAETVELADAQDEEE